MVKGDKMYNAEKANTALKRLGKFEVDFRDPVGSMEGPRWVLDLMRVYLCVPKVP